MLLLFGSAITHFAALAISKSHIVILQYYDKCNQVFSPTLNPTNQKKVLKTAESTNKLKIIPGSSKSHPLPKNIQLNFGPGSRSRGAFCPSSSANKHTAPAHVQPSPHAARPRKSVRLSFYLTLCKSNLDPPPLHTHTHTHIYTLAAE